MDDVIRRKAEVLIRHCEQDGLSIATAESCTGGLVAAALTSVVGASRSFTVGLVCYSNRAKMRFLGVERELLKTEGAVSEACARAMAEGAMAEGAAKSGGIALATTGIAGPGGGTEERPVGLVHIAVATPQGTENRVCRFGLVGREEIRLRSTDAVLSLALDVVRGDRRVG